MLDFVIFAVTVAIVLIVAIIYLYPGTKRVTTIPGPDISDPLEGNLPDIAASGSLHEFLLDLHDKYGPIVHFWMPQLTVSICSPELYKQHAKVFDRPPELFQLFKPLIGPDSIQYANKGDGRMRHTAYSRCYSYEAMENYYSIIQKMTNELVHKWSTLPSDEHVPLRKYMFAFAIKTMLQSSFGKYFEDEKEVMKLKKSYDMVWNDMEKQLLGEILEEGTPRKKLFDKEVQHMYDTMDEVLKEAKKKTREEGDPKKLLDVMIEMNMSESKMASDMMSLFVAGFHTTGTLLTWALYFLASHKDVQDKAYNELTEVLSNENVTSQIVSDLIYLRQVIDEALRCSRMAPIAARVQDFDSELGGHVIPKGTPVVHALGVTLSDPKLWPEPDKFDPERFNEENRRDIPNFAFEPFGFAGKRKCLGYRFSLVEATIFLADVLRKFEISMVPGQVVIPEYGLVTSPKEEIWIMIQKRK